MAKVNTEARKSLDDFLSYTSQLEGVRKNEQRKDHPANEVSDKYDSARKKFAEETVNKYHPNVDAASLTEEDIERYNSEGVEFARNLSAQSIRKELKGILDLIDTKKLSKTLEDFLSSSNDEVISTLLSVASDEERKILSSYKGYSDLSKIVSQYEKIGNKNAPKELKEQVYALAAKGVQEATEKRLTDMGLSKKNAKIGAQLESLAVREGNYEDKKLIEYSKAGLKTQLEELNKEIPQDKYIEAIKSTLSKLIKSEKTAEYELGAQILYNAAKPEKKE